MAYEPEFMKRFEEYNKEKQAIKTLEDWRRFKKKWFDWQNWPRKTAAQQREYEIKCKNPIQAGGRTWHHTLLLLDITPEARYEYSVTSDEIGFPLAFPNGIHKPQDLSNTYGWSQECPFDEIATDEIGDEICPVCGRKLIYVWTGD